ncbi:hypothetical protein [Azospirillum palustre]|nr:hypothetical protein [Azospirillum palustre]
MNFLLKSLRTIALVALVGSSAPAFADSIASEMPIGATYEGSVKVSRTQVPLPPGKWTVTALNESNNNQFNVNATVTMTNIVNGRLLGYISVSTNVDLGRNGWQSHKFCSRKDIYFLQFDSDYQREQACWGINHFIVSPTGTYTPTYGKNIQQALAEKGIDMPKVMIDTLFRVANEHSYINYEILLNAEFYGFSSAGESNWASSPWHKDLIAKDPKRRQFLEQVKEQYQGFYPILKSQFR